MTESGQDEDTENLIVLDLVTSAAREDRSSRKSHSACHVPGMRTDGRPDRTQRS